MRFFLFIISCLAASISLAQDMDFGLMEYSGTARNRATMDPITGAISCDNNNWFCPAFGSVGQTTIAGSAGAVVNLSCRKRADISNGSVTLRVNQATIFANGTAIRCNGLRNTVISYTMSGNTDNVQLGARLVVPANTTLNPGTFTTAQSGRPHRVRILFE